MGACHIHLAFPYAKIHTVSLLHPPMSPSSITLQTACLSPSHELKISVLVLYSHTLSQVWMSSVNIFSEKVFLILFLAALMDLLKCNKNTQYSKINMLVAYFMLITLIV